MPDAIGRFQWIDHSSPTWPSELVRSVNEGIRRSGTEPSLLPLEISERTFIVPSNTSLDVKVSYPEFLPANSAGVADANALLSVFARQRAHKLLAAYTDANQTEFNLSGHEFFYWLTPEVMLVRPNFISVRFSESIHTGGVHPNYFTHTFNLLRSPFIECEFDALVHWEQHSDFVNLISDLCIEQLVEKRRSDSTWIDTKEAKEEYIRERMDWLTKGAGHDSRN